jgi:hypothetical protein
MSAQPDLTAIFEQLRLVMQKHAGDLEVIKDVTGDYSLNGDYSEQYKKVIWFGGVKKMKNYVSYHLIAVYAFPQLGKELSPELRRRMHGKSCFNFTQLDDATVEELSSVTARSVDAFRKARWLATK